MKEYAIVLLLWILSFSIPISFNFDILEWLYFLGYSLGVYAACVLEIPAYLPFAIRRRFRKWESCSICGIELTNLPKSDPYAICSDCDSKYVFHTGTSILNLPQDEINKFLEDMHKKD